MAEVVTQQPSYFALPAQLKMAGAVPPGLEYLAQIDHMLIKQQVEVLELLTGFETNNKYKIFNSMNQQIYFAAEETGCIERQLCGPSRGFTIHVTDNTNKEVMQVIRDFKCCAGFPCFACCDPCALECRIEAPIGQTIGYIRQMCSPWKPKMGVFNGDHELVARIEGPCCICNGPCCGDVEFPVISLENSEEQVGMCAKKWSGFVLEAFTSADNYSVRFPMEMDVKVKATLLGAIFMIVPATFILRLTSPKDHTKMIQIGGFGVPSYSYAL